jgi:hypothetical protein
VALVAVLFVAGCGGGGSGGGGSTQTSSLATKPANVVVRDAAKAVKDASSFHMSGQVRAGSGMLGAKSIGLDLTVVRDKGATGSMTLGGAKIDLIVTGNNGYLRAGPAFWKLVASKEGNRQMGGFVAQLFGNKWIKFPANNKQFGALTDPANPNSLFKSLTRDHGKLANKGETTYKGQSVVAIQDTTQGGTLYVAATGTPYPVALIKTGGKNGGSITFDNWNQSVTVTAPKGAVDLSKFAG